MRAAGEFSGHRADFAVFALPAASQSSQHIWEQIPAPEVLVRLVSIPALCSPGLGRRSCIQPWGCSWGYKQGFKLSLWSSYWVGSFSIHSSILLHLQEFFWKSFLYPDSWWGVQSHSSTWQNFLNSWRRLQGILLLPFSTSRGLI